MNLFQGKKKKCIQLEKNCGTKCWSLTFNISTLPGNNKRKARCVPSSLYHRKHPEVLRFCPHTWLDLHGALAGAALSLTVSHSQGEAVLPLHQVSQKQHCLVVRVVQYILLKDKKNEEKKKELKCLESFVHSADVLYSVRLTPAAGLLSSLVHR